jgi:hypothetical protein
MLPYTVELLLNTILPWLEAAVETASPETVPRGLLLVKISICGPPGTPTLKVPVIPETDISTPLSRPSASNGMVPGPTAVCLAAKLGGHQAVIAATHNRRTGIGFIVIPHLTEIGNTF